jgi:fatty-acyl-CoA synthase
MGAVAALFSPHLTDAELVPRLDGLAHLIAPPDRLPRCAAVLGIDRVSAPPDPAAEPAGTGARRARLRAMRPRRGRADLVLHTSGTSGQPKGARISSAGWGPAMPFALIERLDLPVGLTLYTPCPIDHAAPQLLCGLAFVLGGEVVISARLDPDEAAAVWRRRGVTHALLVPTLIDRLVASPASLPALRGMLSAGAPLGVGTWEAATRRFGPIVRDLYGATELGVVSVATPEDLAAAPGTVGRPLPGVSISIRDAHGQPVADGEVGILHVASSMQMMGYEGLEAPGAWLTVGDLARLHEGRLFLVGRDRDMILTGGVNVFPGEVEAVLKAHPSVSEAAVVGVPDATWGERVEAFVVPRAPVSEASLHAWCEDRLARFKRPKAIHLRDALPVSPTGKVLKRLLAPLETT